MNLNVLSTFNCLLQFLVTLKILILVKKPDLNIERSQKQTGIYALE